MEVHSGPSYLCTDALMQPFVASRRTRNTNTQLQTESATVALWSLLLEAALRLASFKCSPRL